MDINLHHAVIKSGGRSSVVSSELYLSSKLFKKKLFYVHNTSFISCFVSNFILQPIAPAVLHSYQTENVCTVERIADFKRFVCFNVGTGDLCISQCMWSVCSESSAVLCVSFRGTNCLAQLTNCCT